MACTVRDIAKMIDLSLLNPTMTREVFERGIADALELDVASVCIVPYYLRRCSERLAGSAVAPSTVIGFPHGTCLTRTKIEEAKSALADGGRELDMVVNISAVLSGDWSFVEQDIKAVIDVTHAGGARVKVIFENCYLQDEHKIRLCEICGRLGADWVKTSTGYGTGGAVDADLVLMRKHSPAGVQIKAAGGVRDLDRALQVRELGCTRFGCTKSREILAAAAGRLPRG